MSITNYTELQIAIKSWLNRADIDAYIPDFITLAEARMNDDLRTREMETRTTDTVSTSTRYLDLPTRFGEMIKLIMTYDDAEWYPDFQINEQMRKFRSTVAGQPNQYALWGSQLEFNRIPAAAYTAEYWYYQKVQPLSDSVTTNDILDRYPNLYLYCSLIQAEPFLKNDNRIALWEAMYTQGLTLANNAHMKSKTSGPKRARSSRAVV